MQNLKKSKYILNTILSGIIINIDIYYHLIYIIVSLYCEIPTLIHINLKVK